MIIKIDHENNGEIFWDAVEAAGANCPPALAMLRDGHTEAVNVSEQDAAEALAWCKRAPGWAGGPSYAPHPLIFTKQ